MKQSIAIVIALAAAAAVSAVSWHATRRPDAANPTSEDVPFAAAPAAAEPPPTAAAPGPFQETQWSALVPGDWEPAKTFSDDIARLGDSDSRAMDALVKLREAWANAPVEPSMDGQRIRIGGYVIPLDSENGAVTEFLLVPYFGACIHAPPPPANQVIHVFPGHPLRGMAMMAPVLVSGTLRLARNRSPDSAAGLIDTIGYDMRAESVANYKVE